MDKNNEFNPQQIENVKVQKEETITVKKKKFVQPKIEILKFQSEDVLTESGWNDEDELPDD